MKKVFLWCVIFCGTAQATPYVEVQTNLGSIVLELNEDKAPATVANFLRYVNEDFYTGTIFHRVIDGFMIQGGGYSADFEAKPTQEPIANEAHNGLENDRGTIAMARTNAPHSATSQFFINLVDNDFLNANGSDPYGYAVFGQVINGMDVVERIASIPTTAQGPFASDVPTQPVEIISTTVMESWPMQENPSETVQEKQTATQ